MPRFRLQINGREREFEAVRQGSGWRLAADDLTTEVSVTPLADGVFQLEYPGPDGETQRVRVAGHRAGDNRQLWIDGRMVQARRVRQQGQAGAADSPSLAASIPAVVSQVLVAVGDSVAAGDKLILLESMKMVIPIQAPADGRVARINCAAGDSVPAGLVLVELEPL